MAKDKAAPSFQALTRTEFYRTAHKNLLQIAVVIDTGCNGNGAAGLLHISGHPFARRTGKRCCDGCRSAAAAVFPVEGIRPADVDGRNHLLRFSVAEDEAVRREIFAVDVVFQGLPIDVLIKTFKGLDEVDKVRNPRKKRAGTPPTSTKIPLTSSG